MMGNTEKVDLKLLEDGKSLNLEIKSYRRRWIILTIFIIYACISSIQWIEYSSITHIVVKYYNVTSLAVDWTSIVYMAVYPIFAVPASYVVDKKGLRTAGLIGCIGSAVGTGIKVLSIRNDLFFVILLGQAVVAASQVIIVCLPPKIASIWFKSNEVSTACSLGVFGVLLGTAIGYVLPPLIVKDSNNLDDIGTGLKMLCWLLTGSMIPVTIAVIFYFPKQPPLPPSNTQASLRKNQAKFKAKTFFISMRNLFLNKPFVIHMVAYSISIGVFCAVGTLLNQFILQYFEGANEDAGRMGFAMIITGMAGSLLFGILLDKTHKYKEVALFIYFSSAVSIICLMYSLEWRSIWLTYISCGLIGFVCENSEGIAAFLAYCDLPIPIYFVHSSTPLSLIKSYSTVTGLVLMDLGFICNCPLFTNSYMPVGFELAMELTFPSEESTTTGILIAISQVLGVIFTVGLSYLNQWAGCFWSLASQSILLFIGSVITGCIPNKLLRQEAFRQANNDFSRKVSVEYQLSTFT